MKKSPTIWFVQAIALSSVAIPAHARTDIVVNGALDDPSSGAAGAVMTLGHDDIAAQAPVSALESLALLPGIDAFEKDGLGGGSYLSVRGGEPNYALVTINGVRVNDPMQSSGGSFDFSLLGPQDISRIDVLNGPWSTSYGADALSGVVAIRVGGNRKTTGASFSAGAGTGERYDVSARADLVDKGGALTLIGSDRDTRNLLSGSTNSGQSVMLAASPALGDVVRLDLFGLYSTSRGQGFPEDSGGPELAVNRALETRDRTQYVLGGTASAQFSDSLRGQIRASWGRSEYRADTPAIAPGALDAVPAIVSDSRFDRFELVSSLDWARGSDFTMSAGASVVREDGRAAGSVDFGSIIPTGYVLSRTLPGVFATATYTPAGGPVLRAGVRADFPEQGPTRVTPQLGAVVPLAGGLSLTADYARGFKQPSFFALGYPLVANPDLLPERSETYDAGVQWKSPSGNWQASAKGYRSVFKDMIDFDPNLFTNVNRQKVTAKGFEFAASGHAGPVRTIASLTYLKSWSADGAPLRFRPHWKGAAAIEWQANSLVGLRLDGRFVSSFLDSTVPTGFERVAGFATFDTQVTLRLSHGLHLVGSLRNLTDKRYYRTIGTPEPGRNVFVSLRADI